MDDSLENILDEHDTGDYDDCREYSNNSSFIDSPPTLEDANNRNLYPRYPQCWIKDDIVDNCYNCQQIFSWLTRKHHCRSCGRIFCSKCSDFYIELPHTYISFPKKPNNLIKKKISNILTEEKKTKERVCLQCYEKILNLKITFKYVKVFEILELDMGILNRLSLVNKKWNYSANTLLMKIQEIQYYPSGKELTELEKKMLWINRKYFMGHSKWLSMLMKIVNWSNVAVTNEILSIIDKPKCYSCNQLGCVHNCATTLNTFDILDLISNIIPNKTLNNYLIDELNSLDYTELIIYLPLLVYYIRHETNENMYISNMIINKCIDIGSRELINYFHWLLVINCECGLYYSRYNEILSTFIQTITNHLEQNILNEINKSFNFVHILNNIPTKANKDNIIEYLKYMVKNHKLFSDTPLYLPIDSSYQCIDIQYDGIDIKNSATAPIHIPIICQKNNKIYNYHIIYKNEDMRVDMVIMNLIHMMDLILKREEQLDLHIKKYKILPTSPNSGMIQMVDNAETLYNISQNKKLSILNYIMDHNPNSKIEDIRGVFIKSCAAYCVITYLLGIGDRHLDNIMVTERGHLFHIDYSFILGREPKIITVPKIRITPEMLDAIGGENSNGFIYFKQMVSRTYKCLRKHYNVFINMLMILSDISDRYDKNQIKEEIINRCLLGQTHVEAELDIVTHISQSKSTHYGQHIIDFFHYHQKEQTINNVVSCANNISSNMYNIIWGE